MRVPYSWLKAYVEIDLPPEALAERLTMAGLEVERVEYPWPGVVTAEIIWQERIPGSDHLWATRVSTGTEELSVVCGAPNIHARDKVPLARVGAKVAGITIAPKSAMGVLSEGMLCSPRELGLSDDHSGIYLLPPETPLGMPLGRLLGEPVIELDIKANRGDLSSIVGIAREVSAFTGMPLRLPEAALRESGARTERLMALEVRAPDLCPRYTARVIRGVTIGASPRWMAERLIAAGMRPINTVVDATNYVMLELGEPLHAFDYDKVAGHTLIVRRAVRGETLITLDGVTRQLTPDMLLITDPVGPAVIAGIFGGSRVEVSETTTNLILEAAHFSPANVHRTSQALSLRTESSSRFEKNPDIALTEAAIDRAAQLITELAGGTVARGRIDFYPAPVPERELDFDIGQVAWLTGMTLTRGEAVAALGALGFGVEELPEASPGALPRVRVPSWRADVEESADLVEEVARIVGYDRVPSMIPSGPLPQPAGDPWFGREDAVRDVLAGAGLTEIVSYSLTSKPAMARLLLGAVPGEELLLGAPVPVTEGMAPPHDTHLPDPARQSSGRRRLEALAERLPAITLVNPGSSEQSALRLTLLAGLLDALRENAKYQREGLWLFELGRRYVPTAELRAGTGLADERRTIGVAITGPLARSWQGASREADFFAIKGLADLLLGALGITQARFSPSAHPTFHPSRCAALAVRPLAVPGEGDAAGRALDNPAAWLAVGVLGEAHPEVAARFDLPGRTYLMELDLRRLYLAVPPVRHAWSVPRVPPAVRDLAIVLDAGIAAADVAGAIMGSSPLVREARLFDVYTGAGIPEGKRSLAYSVTYQAAERTLGEVEIERAQAAVVESLRARFGAALRG